MFAIDPEEKNDEAEFGSGRETTAHAQEGGEMTPPLPEALSEDSHPKDPAKPDPGREDLLATWGGEDPAADEPIGLVRLGEDPTPLIPFTRDMRRIMIHYCEEPEIKGYVRCNGEGCVLCGISRPQDERGLLPVYCPTTKSVGVLAISKNSRPGALLPQLLPVLKESRRIAMTIARRDQVSYRVNTMPLTEDLDDGAAIVAGFLRRWDKKEVDLADVYQRHSNEDLAEIHGIKTRLQFLRKPL